MPKCLSHKQVQQNFIEILQELCQNCGVTITSDSDININIDAYYNLDTNLYESYGATFVLDQEGLNKKPVLIKEFITDTKNFPRHTR